ncbi:MAG: Wzz/FepE/Etk N-terminal domain-containing protein [Chloroflexota bacterium]
MTTQQPDQTWDEGVDLRAAIDALFRHRWLIMALVILAIGAAGVLSYMVMPPTYEPSVVVTLPAAGGTDGLGLPPSGYKEFAASNRVIAAVQQKLGTHQTPSELAGQYDVQLDEASGLLTVTASAETADATLQLASLWVGAFSEQTLAVLRAQLARQKAVAEQAAESLLSDVTKAEDVLAAFDQKTPISLEEARLSDLEKSLVSSEGRLRELTFVSLPIDEARLAFFQNALDKESQTLGSSQGGVVLPKEGSNAGVTSQDVTILNPVYLQFSQDLAVTRTSLATGQREEEIMEERISSLQREVDGLREEVIQDKTERQRLDLRINEARAVYNSARLELDRLLDAELHLPELSSLEVVNEPVRPEAPSGPRKVIIMAIAGVAAALSGVVIAILLEWYRGEGETEASRRRMGTPAPSPSDR